MKPGREGNASGADERAFTAQLRDPAYRSACELLHAEMFEQLAPATEGHRVNPGCRRRGRLVFGDADE
jgi:hypothetical protein